MAEDQQFSRNYYNQQIIEQQLLESTPQCEKQSLTDSTQVREKHELDLSLHTINTYQQKSQRGYSDHKIQNFSNNSINYSLDRYIPNRKYLDLKTFLKQQQNIQNNQQNPEITPTYYQVSQLYKKYLLEPKKYIQQNNNKQINTYKNINFFKFNKQKYSRQNLYQQQQYLWKCLKNIKKKRKVNQVPIKVLDAPSLQNDFYLNVIDWGFNNLIAVGLSSCVYLWNANNSKVTKLCDLGVTEKVCSTAWSLKDPILVVGSTTGEIKLWDIQKLKVIKQYNNHQNRVSVLAWNSKTLASGSRDKHILLYDPRQKQYYKKLISHKQQVCGLKWSPDQQQLASGGNDNKLFVWDQHFSFPVHKFIDHKAAVKAIAWSPHHHGLLISGGGTADRTIKFRNTITGTTTKNVQVNSQVCNLSFSKVANELISTHGYTQNQINIWSCPNMHKIAKLTGHTHRVLYIAMSPDSSTIVTGAGDETLRFWNIYQAQKKSQSQLTTLQKESHSLR